MLVYSAFSLPFIILARCIVNLHLEQRGIRCSVYHSVGCVLFAVCFVCLFSQTIVPNTGMVFAFDEINLVPFRMIADYTEQIREYQNYYYVFINFFGNLLLFVPLGFFPCLLWKRASLKNVLLLSFSVSFGIEFIQLFEPNRKTDIDDIILNFLGGIAGYLLYKLANRFFGRFAARFQVELPKHISKRKQLKKMLKLPN